MQLSINNEQFLYKILILRTLILIHAPKATTMDILFNSQGEDYENCNCG